MKLCVSKEARRNILKLDKPIQERVLRKMNTIKALNNPRSQGDGLTGSLAGLWRYRVGDYRIICKIKDDIVEILVIKIAYIAEVY